MIETETLLPNTQIEEGERKEVIIDPRVFVCSFPKSGTHLAEQLVQPIVTPMPADKPWAGTFQDHSWTTRWAPVKKVLQRIGYIRDGTYAKGHLGYTETIENYLYGIGAAVLFVYRDLRDVAVSLTHHILDGKTHSRNEWYQAIGFDAALMAVIQGLGPYAGVLERWNLYAGWLDVPWVQTWKFGMLVNHKEQACRDILRYIVGHAAAHRGFGAELSQEVEDQTVALMIANSERTERSPTYRSGLAGAWRKEFKPAHCVAFAWNDWRWSEEYGLDEPWLVHLGFEDDPDWWKEHAIEDDETGGEDD
jgi:hypothetical protein